jgi:hypothetical protein
MMIEIVIAHVFRHTSPSHLHVADLTTTLRGAIG